MGKTFQDLERTSSGPAEPQGSQQKLTRLISCTQHFTITKLPRQVRARRDYAILDGNGQ